MYSNRSIVFYVAVSTVGALERREIIMPETKAKLIRDFYTYKDSVSGRTKNVYTFTLFNWEGKEVARASWDCPVPPSDIKEKFRELAKQHPSYTKPIADL